MTAAEAIEKEIQREEQELKALQTDADQLGAELMKIIDDAEKRSSIVRELSDGLRHIISQQGEIEGKKLALAAVKAKPADPLGAIDAEYDAEHKQADELGRKAQALREKIFREHHNADNPPPREDVAELKKLSDAFDDELARLRGKAIARGAASAALKGH